MIKADCITANYTIPNSAMNAVRAEDALRILSEQAAEREHQLSTYSSTKTDDLVDNVEAECPIFDSFHQSGGHGAILKMSNFAPFEFRKLYSIKQPEIVTSWNVGRGRRSQFQPMDVLFMALVVLNYGGSWDQLGTIFRVKGCSS